jgi:tRNA 2-thiouridine synthesizing protein E
MGQEGAMATMEFEGKEYEVDEMGFLVHPQQWDEGFAKGSAPRVGILSGLTSEHWCILSYIRNTFAETGMCPMMHEIGKDCGMKLTDLKRLFPSGYLRGACKLAGLTYMEEEVHSSWLPTERISRKTVPLKDRAYRIDIWGFLIDPAEWDQEYAILRARDMKMKELKEKHWRIIRFLREQFEQTGTVPTFHQTCETHNLEIDQFGELFPDGYNRGAVKIAGLRLR